MKNNLYIFDIDRTIKPYFSDIPQPTKIAIQELQKHHTVALATGRAFSEAINVARLLQIDYLICNGGSDVYYKEQLIYQKELDFSAELELLKKEKPIHFFVADKGVFSYNYPKWLKKIAFFKHFYPKISSIYGLINLMGEVEEMNRDTGQVHKFYVIGKYQGTLDYKRIGNIIHTYEFEDKSLGTLFLKSHLGNIDEMIAFGDSHNDIKLFEVCDRCYANEKGNEQLKFIATDCFNIKNGIYKIVKEELEKD